MKLKLFSDKFYNSGVAYGGAIWQSITGVDPTTPRTSSSNETIYRIGNTEPDFFGYILDSVGIDYEYTEDLSASNIVVVDIGSSEWNTACKEISKQYPKAIVFSSQEPADTDVKQLLDKHKNIFVMDAVYHPTPGVFHERYIPFPSFFSRMLNPFFNTVIAYHSINLHAGKPNGKKLIFNNLKYRNTYDKSLTQYFLNKNNLVNEATTYRRDNGFSIGREKQINPNNIKQYIGCLTQDMETSENKVGVNDFKDFLLHSNNIDLDDNVTFSRAKRYWPLWIFNDTYFSIANESVCGLRHFFTEKSLYPLMMGHPLIINGSQVNAMYKILEQFGFVMHDHILNYDVSNNMIDTNLQNIDNIRNFKRDRYSISFWETIKRSHNNRKNFLNVNSILWQNLSATMNNNLDKYLEFKQ